MPKHNEYFDNEKEGQNKATELVGYFFHTPLIEWQINVTLFLNHYMQSHSIYFLTL